MAIRKIREIGDEILTKHSKEVTQMTPRTQMLIEDMLETMYEQHGVGLAAPQVGILKRIVVIDVGEGPLILINPVITPLGIEEQEDWEGCLSVPGLRGKVPRWSRIRYAGFDPYGTPIDRSVEGFHARVVQHECDHLVGKLYPMRMRDFTQFGFTEVLFPEIDAAEDD